MHTLLYSLRRLPHLSREEFQRYWKDVHAPLVAERAAVLGIVRYVQRHTPADTTADAAHAGFRARNGGSPEEFDGFAELTFRPSDGTRNEAAAQAAAELLADERHFIDLPNSPATLVQDHAVICREVRVLVPTADHDGTLAWYQAIFGWPVVRGWPGGSLVAIDGDTRLEIIEGNDLFPPVERLEGTTLVVQTADVAGVHAAAAAAGATIEQAPALRPWGHVMMLLRDPNGLRIAVFEVPKG